MGPLGRPLAGEVAARIARVPAVGRIAVEVTPVAFTTSRATPGDRPEQPQHAGQAGEGTIWSVVSAGVVATADFATRATADLLDTLRRTTSHRAAGAATGCQGSRRSQGLVGDSMQGDTPAAQREQRCQYCQREESSHGFLFPQKQRGLKLARIERDKRVGRGSDRTQVLAPAQPRGRGRCCPRSFIGRTIVKIEKTC